MVQLQGSEKQIKWAEEIREMVLRNAPAMRAQFGNAPNPEQREKAEAALAAVEAQASAAWWIDHRGIDIKRLMIEFYQR